MERAERNAENRGIPFDCEIKTDETDTGMKRKRPNNGLVKGEAGFLRGAKTAGVRVVRAPRGMTRNKENTSKWNPKYVTVPEITVCLIDFDVSFPKQKDTSVWPGQWSGLTLKAAK